MRRTFEYRLYPKPAQERAMRNIYIEHKLRVLHAESNAGLYGGPIRWRRKHCYRKGETTKQHTFAFPSSGHNEHREVSHRLASRHIWRAYIRQFSLAIAQGRKTMLGMARREQTRQRILEKGTAFPSHQERTSRYSHRFSDPYVNFEGEQPIQSASNTRGLGLPRKSKVKITKSHLPLEGRDHNAALNILARARTEPSWRAGNG